MKAKINFYALLLFIFISQIYSLSNVEENTLHDDHELPMVCNLEDGGVFCVTKPRGSLLESKMARFNKNAKPIFNNRIMDERIDYSGSAQLFKLQNSNDSYGLFYSNKKSSTENLLIFSDHGKKRNEVQKKSTYQMKSAIGLKNGKIFLAGLNYISTNFAETSVELNLYDPNSNQWENGLSFASHSKFISCYEQKENNVYCAYISYDDVFIRKLKIKHIYVDDTTLVEKEDKVIKTFYTEFNFLKAIPFNEKEILILFQTGNNQKENLVGNSGQELFFYHLELSPTLFIVAKRYEFLSNECEYIEDPEDYNADIIALTKNKIYAICRSKDNELKAFEIIVGEKEIIRFNINLLAAKGKNPVLTKFDKSLAIFYNHISLSSTSKVSYFLINYPDCEDYSSIDNPALLPKRFFIRIDLSGKIYINNPLPANRANEVVYFRILDNSNIIILNSTSNVELLKDKDYEAETPLKFSTDSLEGNYSIEFQATRKDKIDGLILGRTCNIHLNTPKCLPQCYSCTQEGNNLHHYCLGCVEGPFYEEKDDTTVNEGYGKPHNCEPCNISCSSCFGRFLFNPRTTNCKKCDYEKGYYHLAGNNRTCISKENQEEWEEALNISIYLDDSPGEENKDKWRWRYCHKNCKKCHGPGTEEDNQCDECKNDLYFYCNQTLGNGIPGSCHNDCLNNGFFLKKDPDDKMEKCCPCLDDCKVCKNETKCEECFEPFYKTPEWDRCNKTCNSCLAYDDELKECVFCKTRYEYTGLSPRYLYNQRCVYPIPLKYHVIDEICYNITTCDDSCFTCWPEGTAKCTKCAANYYKEDFFGLKMPKTFRCFNKTNCLGIHDYKTEEEKIRVGGVPITENGEGVCLNCKLRNNSYRLPENDFYCGEKIKKTFVEIESYNKLTRCYTRCKECDSWGNSCFMNCSSCLDSDSYELHLYDVKRKHGNCLRKTHKCGIYPYYHDYNLAEKLGLDEDHCGEKCDVCLYNFSCTENLPYFNFETHECVEFCPLTKVLDNQCQINNSAAFISIFQNPFGTKSVYDSLNNYADIKKMVSSELAKYFGTDIERIIENYIGTGEVVNLPESKIIALKNISIELTSNRLEEEKVEKIKEGETEAQTNTSILNISQCEAFLKKKYRIPEEEELVIIKGDIIENLTDIYTGNKVEYQLFSTSMGAFLPLGDCENQNSGVEVTNPFYVANLFLGSSQNKIGAVISNGYDVFDSSSPFYNDVCSPFTNENGNDVLLDERRSDYFSENLNLCEKGCIFDHYSVSLKMYTCNCPVKAIVGENLENKTEYEPVIKEFPESFFKKHKHSNIEVFKCSSQVFSAAGQTKNFGSYCLLICLSSFIGVVAFYFFKGKEKLNILFNGLNNIASPPNPKKPVNEERDKYDDLMSNKTIKNPKNVPKDIVLEDEQLNSAIFEIAVKQDYRGYLRIYWSLLKMKQLFIFTFYTYKDYNLRSAKITLFILFVSFYFAFTALFFNDNIMRQIYIYKGNTNAAVHIPNIFLSSLSCIIMNFIVRFVSLSERDISKINYTKGGEERKDLCKKIKKIYKIKIYILFAVSGILIFLCWYYVAAFCAVFKNSQGHYFINLLVAFIVCNIWPCVTSLITPIIRRKSLDSSSKCMYKFSQIISYF